MKKEPCKLDVKDMFVKEDVGSRKLFDIQVSPSMKMDEENTLKSYEGRIKLTLLEDEIIADFQINYIAETVCARCLRKFKRKDEVRFDRQYKLGKRMAEGDELIVDKDFQIETGEPIYEEIVFDIPMKPLCNKSCEGLSPNPKHEIRDRLKGIK